jgi:hypothetical protein
MKTLIITENSRGRTAKVNATTTYQAKSGNWVAEVDGTEFNDACSYLCKDVEGCTCEGLHVEADQDDDGKEYRISSS